MKPGQILYLYAIRDEEMRIKIGISYSPLSRMKQLQIGNSSTLELLGFCDAGLYEYEEATDADNDEVIKDSERSIHKYLKSLGLHERGEWFSSSIYTTIIANAISVNDLQSAGESLVGFSVST